MKLYHGSNQYIREIDLAKSKNYKDFGRGFYMTADYSRAINMAIRTTAIEREGEALISPFLFYQNRLDKGINIKRFKGYTAEWALFVLENRNKTYTPPYCHEFDIVIGPVADSRVDDILEEYRMTYPDTYKEKCHLLELAKKLKFPGPIYTQYCFCTELAIQCLICDL